MSVRWNLDLNGITASWRALSTLLAGKVVRSLQMLAGWRLRHPGIVQYTDTTRLREHCEIPRSKQFPRALPHVPLGTHNGRMQLFEAWLPVRRVWDWW